MVLPVVDIEQIAVIAPLNPEQLTPAASLSGLRIIDIPDFPLEANIKDKVAYDLVSTEALIGYIRQSAHQLNIEATSEQAQLPVILDRRFQDEDYEVRATAAAVATRMGRNLGYILLALKRGDAVNRAARTDWDDTYWRHWANIQHVWLGGGLVRGHLGRHMLLHARSVFQEANLSEITIDLTPHPKYLPLIGAALSAPVDAYHALVFDFGASFIKRAYATYDSGNLTRLECFPVLPANFTRTGDIEIARAQADRIVKIITETWAQVSYRGITLDSTISASIACYVEEGRLANRGVYGKLQLIADNFASYLSDRVSLALSQPITVRLIHDGTAGAMTYAGQKQTAVLTLGTAIGIGYPPPANKIRPFSPGVEILE